MEPINIYYWTYLSDRPVGLKNDLLWEGKTIREEIDQMAERIVSPLDSSSSGSSDQNSSSITFAIHGRWGMGKSTALRMLEEAIRNLAEEKHIQKRLYFCKYSAPSYEALSHSYDARTTMALSILTTLAGSAKDAIDKFLGDALAIGKLNEILPPGADEFDDRKTNQVLSRMAVVLSGLVDFDKIVEHYLKDEQGLDSVLVVLIDDLDRCDTDFIWQVLNSIQQLSDIPNIFFVLAVDQDLLAETVRERFKRTGGATDPEFALEKYIQHSVKVPDLNAEGLKILVSELLKSYREKDFVSNAIVENIEFFQYGLKVLTPRSIKRCLNTIRPDLKRKLHQDSPVNEQQKVVKERILEYVWPEFYHKHFLPTQHPENVQSRLALTAVEVATMEDSNDMERMRFSLKRISTRFGINLEVYEGDEKLWRYLGRPPYWFETASPEGKKSRFSDALLGLPSSGRNENINTNNLTSFSASSPLKTDPEDEFLRLYFQAEAAEAAKRYSELHERIIAFYDLVVNNRDHFTRHHASTIGNMAINAEVIRAVSLAVRLYELALELDPEHSNNLQNFVDLIIQIPLPDYYSLAHNYIKKLKTGKHARHKPERTVALEARLYVLTTEENVQIDEDTVNDLIAKFLEDPSNQRIFISVGSLLSATHNSQALRSLGQAFYSAAENDSKRLIAIITVAGGIWTDEDDSDESDSNELEAMDMYRYVITFWKETLDKDTLATVLHNYATLLYNNDFRAEAGRMWFEAYQLTPEDSIIQRSFGLYLSFAHYPDLAAIVSTGEPIKDMKLIDEPKELPERFLVKDIDRWWERTPTNSAQ